MALWELDSEHGILPAGALRSRNAAGEAATVLDVAARQLHPLEWSTNFSTALCEVAKLTQGDHKRAVDLLLETAAATRDDQQHQQHLVAEIMTQDVLAVLKDLRKNAALLDLAEEAVNAATNVA